jgi:hypothetical protein
MGHLDKELGIKSVIGIKIYLKEHFKDMGHTVDLDCVKVANSVRTFWAVNNKLHSHDMKGSVIYVLQESDLDELINKIKTSILVYAGNICQ